MYGMRIKFHKCDLISINVDEVDAHIVAQTFTCRLSHFPITHLGASLHKKKLRKENFQLVIDKILKKTARLRGRILNHAARAGHTCACKHTSLPPECY
jgi:hypothetical protein